MGCLVNWAADWVAPGRIQHGGVGTFAVGELDGELSPRVKELADMLGAVTPTQVSSNIWGLKWAKHVYSALLVATALVDAHVYEVVERSPEIQRMLVALVAEGMSVAEAEGIHLEAFDEFDPAWYRAAVRETRQPSRGRWPRFPGSTGATRRRRRASGETSSSGSGRRRSRRTWARRSSWRGATVSGSRSPAGSSS